MVVTSPCGLNGGTGEVEPVPSVGLVFLSLPVGGKMVVTSPCGLVGLLESVDGLVCVDIVASLELVGGDLVCGLLGEVEPGGGTVSVTASVAAVSAMERSLHEINSQAFYVRQCTE